MLYDDLPDILPEPQEDISSCESEEVNQHTTPRKKKPRRSYRKSLSARFYIAQGFIEDCHTLINRCALTVTLNWESFMDVYEELDFDDAFRGRDTMSETVQLCEEMLNVVTLFFVKPTFNYQDQLATLFLLYKLAVSQPIEGFARVWVYPENKEVFTKFERQARSRNDTEALYCLGSLYARGLIKTTFTQQECGLGRHVVHSYSDYIMKMKDQLINKDEISRDQFKEAMSAIDITRDYLNSKKQYLENFKNESDKERLEYLNPNVTAKLCTDLMKLQCKTLFHSEATERAETQTTSPSQPTTMRSDFINQTKQRAMKMPVGKAKYLIALNDKAKDPRAPGSVKKRATKQKKLRKSNQKSKTLVDLNSSEENVINQSTTSKTEP